MSNINKFDPTAKNCLFGAIKLTENRDINNYEYAGYGTGFDSKGTLSHPSRTTGVNEIIFGADMISNKNTYFNFRRRIHTRTRRYKTLCRKNVLN